MKRTASTSFTWPTHILESELGEGGEGEEVLDKVEGEWPRQLSHENLHYRKTSQNHQELQPKNLIHQFQVSSVFLRTKQNIMATLVQNT